MNFRRTYRRADGPLSPSKVSFLRKSLNQQYHVAMDRMEGKPVARRLNLNSEAYKPIHSGLFITGRTFPQRYEREQPREQRQYEPKQADPRNPFEDEEPPEPVDFQERLKQIRSRTDQIVAENSNSFSQEPEEESPPRPRVHFSSFHDEDTFEEEEEPIEPKEEPVPVEPVPSIEEEDENEGLDFYQMFEKFKARTEKMLGEGAAAPAKQSNPSPEQKPKPKQESPVATPTREYLQNPSRSDDITTRITDRLEAFKRRAAHAIEVDTVEPEEDVVDPNDAIYLEEEEETLDPLADVEEEDDQY